MSLKNLFLSLALIFPAAAWASPLSDCVFDHLNDSTLSTFDEIDHAREVLTTEKLKITQPRRMGLDPKQTGLSKAEQLKKWSELAEEVDKKELQLFQDSLSNHFGVRTTIESHEIGRTLYEAVQRGNSEVIDGLKKIAKLPASDQGAPLARLASDHPMKVPDWVSKKVADALEGDPDIQTIDGARKALEMDTDREYKLPPSNRFDESRKVSVMLDRQELKLVNRELSKTHGYEIRFPDLAWAKQMSNSNDTRFFDALRKANPDTRAMLLDRMTKIRALNPRKLEIGIADPPVEVAKWDVIYKQVSEKLDFMMGDLEATVQRVESEHSTNVAGLRRKQLGVDLQAAKPIRLGEDGIPDKEGWEAARAVLRLQKSNPTFNGLSDAEKEKANELIRSYEKVSNGLYEGRNRLLQEIQYSEPDTIGGNMSGSIDHFIRGDALSTQPRFTRSAWWANSEPVGKVFGKNSTVFTHITGKTTKSLLRELYGENSSREIYWPKAGPDVGESSTAQVDKFRVAVNRDSSRADRSLEVFARDASGKWQPFYYVKVGDDWVPAKSIHGVPVEKVCIRCHKSERAENEFSPRPFFLKEAGDFHAVGYQSDALIQELMKY
jgi:hypothetical protein